MSLISDKDPAWHTTSYEIFLEVCGECFDVRGDPETGRCSGYNPICAAWCRNCPYKSGEESVNYD